MAKSSRTYTPTAPQLHPAGTTRKMEPATSAALPAIHGLGADPVPARPNQDNRGRWNDAIITPAHRSPALTNCAREARKESPFSVIAVDAADPRTKSTAVTVSPAPPSQGVVARSGTNASTRATETEMLHTACSVITNMVHHIPMPSAGM